MTFDDYSTEAKKTAIFTGDSKDRLSYLSLAIGGEVGEYQNALKKIYRQGNMPSDVERQTMLLECGDVLWYLDRLVAELGSSLDLVAQQNIQKLRLRYHAKETHELSA